MALTDAQMDAVRHYAGYPLTGTTMPVTADNDIVYMRFGMVIMSLYERLTTLTANQETVLGTYLTTIETLRTAIAGSGDNLDTDRAAVWFHNKNEVSDRTKLYKDECRRMCAFLGLPPGPELGAGGSSIALVRG